MDLTIFGIRGTWVGWVDPEMVLDRMGIIDKNNGYVEMSYSYDYWLIGSNVTFRSDSFGLAPYSMYGWNSVSIRMTNYNGPTSGGQEYAVSVWLKIADEYQDVLSPNVVSGDAGESGDILSDFYCIGRIGYMTSTGMIYDINMQIDNLPNSLIWEVCATDTTPHPELASDPSKYRDLWLSGYNATITTVLCL